MSADAPVIKYWIGKTIAIADVGSKLKAKEVVNGVWSLNQKDPNSVSFEFKVIFGKLDGFVSILIGTVNRSFYFAAFNFTLRDENGDILKTTTHEGPLTGCQYHPELGYGWRIDDFFKPTETKEVSWQFSCNCEVEFEAPSPSNPPIIPRLSTLQQDLMNLLKSSSNADVTFTIKDEKIKAHKSIITARCAHFARMFESGMIESASNEVNIKDIEPAVFMGVLEFLYSGAAPKNLAEIALGLLSLADMYGLDDLKKICEVHLCRNLDEDNFVDALILAEKLSCADLMSSAKSVFPTHVTRLKSSEKLKQLGNSPEALFELLQHLCLE